VNKVAPGLVIIDTTLQYNSEQAAATGMVISPGGLVLTNNHVIENSHLDQRADRERPPVPGQGGRLRRDGTSP